MGLCKCAQGRVWGVEGFLGEALLLPPGFVSRVGPAGWCWRQSQKEEERNGEDRVVKGAARQKRRAGGPTRGASQAAGAAGVSGASGGGCSFLASHA